MGFWDVKQSTRPKPLHPGASSVRIKCYRNFSRPGSAPSREPAGTNRRQEPAIGILVSPTFLPFTSSLSGKLLIQGALIRKNADLTVERRHESKGIMPFG